MKSKVSFLYSIRLRLIAAFLVPIMGILILGVTSYNKASQAIISESTNQTQQTAEVLQEYISLIINSEQDGFKSYLIDKQLGFYLKGSLDKLAAANTRTGYSDSMKEKLNVDAKLSDIYIISDAGKSITGRVVQVADDAYTTFEASAEGQLAAGDEYNWHLVGADDALDTQMGINSGTYALRWVRKITNQPAVIIVDFAADSIRETMNVMDAGSDGYVALVTTDGNEFFSDETVSSSGLIYGQSFYNEAIASDTQSGNKMVTVNGKKYLFVYSKFDDAGDMVAALITEKDILSQTVAIKNLTMTITIFATIIAMVLALAISGSMSRTIQYILKKLNKVAEGDLTTHLNSKGKDELSLLCDGINHTVENVKDLIISVNDISGQVNESAVNMADASDTFKATSGNIQSAVAQIEQGAERLDSNSADCIGQMDTLSGRISEVSSNAEEIGRLTNKAGDMVAEGMQAVQGLTESAAATSRITEEVIAAIRALEERSNAINDIVDSINVIAKQTNLLSLNAGIEAARAGEAGRGFTVVATQIRELSSQCMNSANQISAIVEEIALQTKEVVSIAGQAEQTVASQSQVVDRTKDSFNMINDQVNALIESLQTITASVEQMGESRAQTLKSIESISSVSEETVAYSAEVNDATVTQSDAIGNLDEASRRLQDKADELVSMMKAFVVE